MSDIRGADDMRQGFMDKDQGFAREVETWLRAGIEALPGGGTLPEPVMDRVLEEVEHGGQRQDRRWPLRWPGPQQLLSGGTAAAAGAAILLLSVALLPLATETFEDPAAIVDGTVYRVAADGSGDFATIGEAVAAAEDGDTVLVGPGTYTEALVIEHDITLRGDGDREDAVISAPADGPRAQVELADRPMTDDSPYAVLVSDSMATLEKLTFRGASSVVFASGGAPVLRDLQFDAVAAPYDVNGLVMQGSDGLAHAIVINGGSAATVEGNLITGGGAIGVYDGSGPTVSGNRLIDSQGISGRPGDRAVISGNTLRGGTIHVYGPTTATIEENRVTDAASAAIRVGMAASPGTDPLIRENRVSGSETGIVVQSDALPTIEENELVGNNSGIVLNSREPIPVRGNQLRANASGIFVQSGAPVIEGNTISGGMVGLGLGSEDAAPVLRGNTICGNETNVNLILGAEMPDLAGNAVCSTFHVAQDDSGDFATIGEAVVAAQDGDTVLVAPGTYIETVVIERDITLRGDGPREDIVITAPEDGPRAPLSLGPGLTDTLPYAVLLRDSGATLRDLTFRGTDSVVLASGGAPVLASLRFKGVEGRLANDAFYGAGSYLSAVVINGGSAATIEDSLIEGPGGVGIWDRSDAIVSGNELIGAEVGIRGEPGDEAIIRDNVIRGGREAGILLHGPTAALIEGNTISDVAAIAIQVGGGETRWLGIDPQIRDNTISGSGTAITVGSGASPTIVGNVLTGNDLAIVVADSDLSITGNQLRDNASGIFVMRGAPTLEGNVIEGGVVGLGLGGERATAILAGNTICDNETNVSLAAGAEMPDTAGNRICADAQALASQ